MESIIVGKTVESNLNIHTKLKSEFNMLLLKSNQKYLTIREGQRPV